MRFFWGVLIAFGVLFACVYVEGQKPEYANQTVYGTIVSNGVVTCTHGTMGSNYPAVLVACDDKILARVEVSKYTLAAGYQLVQGERVKLIRCKIIGLIPFLGSDDYGGWLKKWDES